MASGRNRGKCKNQVILIARIIKLDVIPIFISHRFFDPNVPIIELPVVNKSFASFVCGILFARLRRLRKLPRLGTGFNQAAVDIITITYYTTCTTLHSVFYIRRVLHDIMFGVD